MKRILNEGIKKKFKYFSSRTDAEKSEKSSQVLGKHAF